MPAQHRAAHFAHLFEAAAQDGFERVQIAFGRKRHNRQRGNRRAAHGVNVAQRVSRRDRAERERVVHHGREEIYRLHQRQIGSDAIHPGIVRGIVADQHVRIGDARQTPENFVQQFRTKFRRAAAGLYLSGEFSRHFWQYPNGAATVKER